MPTDPMVLKIVERFTQIKPLRQIWESHYQDVKDLVRCDTTDFNRKTAQGSRKYDRVYDGTAIDANEEFSSGLHSYLTSPSERWFELAVDLTGLNARSAKMLSEDPQTILWLEFVSDLIYMIYSDSRTNLNPSLHECYMDLGAFGTCVLNQEWDTDENHLIFRSFALATCYFTEDNKGRVRALWREFEWTGDKILQEFPDLPPEIKKQATKQPNKCFTILHNVCHRSDRGYGRLDSKNKEFASYWVCVTTKEMLRESGYDSFPYHVSRWVKTGEETYGRGPAMKCLPDIKSLQTMERVLLKAGQKAVDPPLVLEDDGFLLPIKTSPGSLIFKEAGAEAPMVLEHKGNLNFGLEQTNQKREYIRKCFHTEWFKRFKKNREQSAHEVMDDREEMLRFLAPMLGRQQTELLGPMIQRTYTLLNDRGYIPLAPQSLRGRYLNISYISPAARAQTGAKADRMGQFMQDVLPMSQIKPEILDAIDMDKMLDMYAKIRGFPRSIIRTPQDMAQIRDDRNKQQQMAQMAQIAEPASKSIKNLADASKIQGGAA